MITLTACLAPAIVSIAKRAEPDWAELESEILRISGLRTSIQEADYDALCADIFEFVGVEYTDASGFFDSDRFDDWPEEHRAIVPLVDDLQSAEFLDRDECVRINAWFLRDSGFVDSASDMSTLNAVRSVVSAAVSERGGIVVS